MKKFAEPVQLELPYVPPKPRPRRFSDDMWRLATEQSMPDIIAWLGNSYKPSQYEEVFEDILDVVMHEDSGYDRLKRLDTKHGWYGSDDDLHEIIACIDTFNVHQQAMRYWVQAYNVKPQYHMGTLVHTKYGLGEITRIIEETAEYVVRCDGQSAGSGYVLAYEDINVSR